MLPFRVELRPGSSPARELVYAATRAVVSGELPPGSPFPSVRILSHELKINPNTAQKAVAELIRSGLLEAKPGIGTLVAEWGPASPQARRELVTHELERFLVEARRVGLSRPEVQDAVAESWEELFGSAGLESEARVDSSAPSRSGAAQDEPKRASGGGERAAG